MTVNRQYVIGSTGNFIVVVTWIPRKDSPHILPSFAMTSIRDVN